MKTLIITLEYPPQIGGIASYVHNYAAHLPAEDVVVYAPTQPGEKEFDTANGWKTYRYHPYWSFIWPHWLRLFFQVAKIVKKEKIEQIHLHQVLPLAYVALMIKKFWHIPYKIFLHGSDVRFASRHKSKLKKFRWVCKQADSVVVNSIFYKNQLENLVDLAPGKIAVVYPCPADLFFAQPPAAEKIEHLRQTLALAGKKVIISVARLVERKGHALFLNSFVKILEKVPNAVWVIVGDGEEKKYLLSLIEKNNLQGAVRFLNALPMEELPAYYYLADLFLLLTHKDKDGVEEAWGTVFLEASACGLPVVAGRSGGVDEAVENLVSGIIVDVNFPEAIEKTVIDLLNNTEYARQLGLSGQERARREFTWEKQISKLN